MYQQTIDGYPKVNIRGTRDGIVFQLPEEGDIEVVIQQLHDAVREGGDVFHNAQVIIDFCDRPPDGLESKQIEQALASSGVKVRRVTASRPGLRPSPDKPLLVVSATDQLPPLDLSPGREAQYIRRTIRSGEQQITEGSLVLLGDIESGSEIIAGGDIIVWGALRGSVRAGANPAAGNPFVCALHFQPTQIRIGRMLATPTNAEVFDVSTPQRAYRDGNSIVIEPWRGTDGRM